MGIRILTGDDRQGVVAGVRKTLGEKYEEIEGENLRVGDLAGLFFGATLFSAGEKRRILVKDLGENKEVLDALASRIEEYNKTENEVVIWEGKLDKRLVAVKALVKAGVEIKEFKTVAKADARAVFGIYDIALRDGARAVRELEKIESEQDPYMFFGLMVSQALRRLEGRPNGVRERAVVRELGKLDIKMKSTGFEPWILVKTFLVRLSAI